MTKGYNEARAFIRQFRHLMDFAKVIEELGYVEEQLALRKVEHEAAASLVDKARAEQAEVENQLRQIRLGIEEARRQAKLLAAEAQACAETIVVEAKLQADEIVKAANEISNGIKSQVSELRSEVSRLDADIVNKKTESANMDKKIDKFRRQLFPG